ncbi:hypothetical protein Rhopal_003457-T1 [Rhodotorula paludigena]|uniref:Proteophosphoglycan ppg4 n=1 Tax=Rhodotorula paludigena TaxID=86838 RepID=A0AAV5GLQ1_9BASI|nr:hypothetical protein Rhopal_003457-T1 [Rhodotorula paludigena]
MASSASSSTAQPHASTRTRPARRAASQLRSLTGYRDASDSDGGSLGSNDGDECYAEEDQDVEIAPAFEPDEDEYNADEGVAAASAVRRSAGKQAAKKPKVVASTSKRQSSKKDKGKERETKSQGADDDAKTSSRRQRLLQMRSVEELEEMWEEEQDALAWVTPTYPPRLRALHTVFRPLKPAGKSKRDQVTAAERSGATVNSPEVIGTCEVLECCHAPDERHRLGKQKPAKDFAKSIQGLSRADFGFNSIDGIFTPGTSFVGAKIGLALVHEASTADECREALDLEMIRSRAATTQAAALATPRSEDYEFELLAKWREIVSQGGPVVSLEQKIAALLLLSLADEGYAAEGPDGKLRVSSIETQDEAARMQSNITFSKHSLFGPTIRIASQVIGPLVPSSGVFGKIKQNIWGTDRVVLLSRPFNDSYRFYLVLPKFTSEKYQIVVPPYAGKLLSVPNTPVLQFGSTAPGEANDWHREVDESIALLPPEQVEAAQDARDEILYLMTFIDKHYQEKKPKSKSDGDRINRSIVALAEREMPQWNTADTIVAQAGITAYGLHIYKHGNTVHVNRGALTRKSRRDYTKPERVFSNIATKQLGLILVSIGTKIFLQTKSREKAELVMAALIDTVIFEDIDDTMRPVVCKTCNELYTQALVPNVKGLVNPVRLALSATLGVVPKVWELVHLIPKIRSEMFITGDLPPQYKIASNFAQAQQMWAGVSGYRTSVDLATDAYLGGDLTMTGLGYPYPRASLDAVGLLPIPSGDDVMFVKHAIPENTVFTTSPINLMAQARPRSDIVLVSLLIAITTVVGVLERGKGEEAFANANHGRATALLHALHDRLVENRCLILQWSYDVDWPPASGGKSPLKVVADKILDGLGPLETFLAHARAMDQFLDDVLRIRNFGDTALPGSEVWYRNMFEHLRTAPHTCLYLSDVPSEQVAEALDALEKNRTARSPVERSTPGRKDLDDPADEERIFNMLLEIERLFEYRFERTEDGFPMMADKAEVEEIKAGGGRPDKAAVIFNLRVRYWRMLLKCDAKYREDVGAEDEEGLFPCFVVVVFYLIAKYSGRDVYCGRLVWFAPAHPQAAGVGHTVPFQPMLTGRTVPHPTSIDDFDFEACNVALRNFNSTRHVVLSVQGELDTADGDVKRCFFKHLLKYLVRVLGADGVHGWSDDEHKLVSSVVGEVLAAEPEELLAPLKDRGYLVRPHLPQTVTLPRETVGTGGVSASAEGGAEAGTSSGATRSGMGQTADEG